MNFTDKQTLEVALIVLIGAASTIKLGAIFGFKWLSEIVDSYYQFRVRYAESKYDFEQSIRKMNDTGHR